MTTWNGAIKPEHHIEHAFTCDETPYFRFTDAFNIPCERAIDAQHIYEEFSTRTDRKFLQAHCTAKQNLYNANPIKLFEIKKLDDQLQERLEMLLPPPRVIENLASVYFFDESENPYKFDRAYGEKKINKWKTGKIVDVEGVEKPADFFLLLPIRILIPHLELEDNDIRNFLAITKMLDKHQLETLYSLLSSNQRNHPLLRSLWSTSDGVKTAA